MADETQLMVWIDQDLCTGDGICSEICPDVFEPRDDGLWVVKEEQKHFGRRVIFDDKGNPDQGSAIAPYASEPDTTPPRVTWSWPDEGATLLPVTSRVGVTFNEMIDVKSAWAGSVRLYRQDLPPDEGRVDAIISAQESIVNLWPVAPLAPDTTYVFEIPAGGIHDFSSNALVEPFSLTFTTEP